MNTAAHSGRTGIREINLQLSKLAIKHHLPPQKATAERLLIPLRGEEITGRLMAFLIPRFYSLVVPQGSSVYHFLGCQVITQEDSVCACECGRAAGQRDSKASLF